MDHISKFSENLIRERLKQIETESNQEAYVSKTELQLLINNFMTLTDDLDDQISVCISASFLNQLKKAMGWLIDKGCKFTDEIDIRDDGIVRDGYGYIYAGTASKIYKVGQKLNKKEDEEISTIIDDIYPGKHPIIMMSKTNKKNPELETYMYFNADVYGYYHCFKVSTNKDAELCQGFRHYIYRRLTNQVKVDNRSRYGFAYHTEGVKNTLNAYPMGTIIEMNDGTYVKASPIGTSTCTELFNGAIDI